MLLCGALTCSAGSGGADMDRFVSDLMAKMSLHEKIGQLNLCGAGDIDTGPVAQTDIASRLISWALTAYANSSNMP